MPRTEKHGDHGDVAETLIPGDLPPLLKLRVVANLLSLSESQVRRMVADGEIPSVRVSEGAVRVTKQGLEKFLAERVEASA